MCEKGRSGIFLERNPDFWMGKAIFITGGTGYLGSHFIETLLSWDLEITIIVLLRNRQKGESFPWKDQVIFWEGDVKDPITYAGEVDYILHGASVTRSLDFVQQPLDTMWTSVLGTRNVFDFAVKKSVEKVLFLSTMEVYGVKNYGNHPVTEEDYGYLDGLDLRNSYPQSKRFSEMLAVAYGKEQGLPVVIGRLTQVFGGKTDPSDGRMFSQFLRTASQGEDIVLKTKGDTLRGYCHIEDALSACAILLEKGKSGEAYTICNPNLSKTVAEIAQEIANFYGTKVLIQEEEKDFGYLPPFQLVLSSEKMESLGWKPEITLEKAFREGK